MVQIDMPMPESCLECPICNDYVMCNIPRTGAGWGENDVREFSTGRPEWCPMKEHDEEVEWCARCGRVRLKSKWEGR